MILGSIGVLAFSFGGALWGVGAVVAFLIGLILITIIMMQDSKEGGLGGAFGGGGGMGGEGLLGARGQKEITRFTGILAIALGVLVIILGMTDSGGDLQAGDQDTVPTLPGEDGSIGGVPTDVDADSSTDDGTGNGDSSPILPGGTGTPETGSSSPIQITPGTSSGSPIQITPGGTGTPTPGAPNNTGTAPSGSTSPPTGGN